MNARALCFMASYRGRGNGAVDVDIIIIAPSWNRAAEMAEEYQDTFPNNLELVEIDKLQTEGALIDKGSL